MRPHSHVNNLLVLSFAILVMSSSGTLGRFILLPPPLTILIRCAIGAVALLLTIWMLKESLMIKRQVRPVVMVSAVLVAIHWVTYFYALQFSTVAIGMLSLFTYPLFTALLEPVILNTPFEKRHLPMTILALVGLYFLVPEFSLSNEYTLGILLGVVSSLSYSVRNILLKKGITNESGLVLMFYQLVVITILLMPLIWLMDYNQLREEIVDSWKPLLILGIGTTAIGHTLFVMSFRYFSVTTVSILSNLTPLFGIGLGIWILGEHPEGNVLIGGSIILSLTIIESFFSMKAPKS